MRKTIERKIIVGDQPSIHVFEANGRVEIWIEPTSESELLGMCIGVGDTERAAFVDAGVTLGTASRLLCEAAAAVDCGRVAQ